VLALFYRNRNCGFLYEDFVNVSVFSFRTHIRNPNRQRERRLLAEPIDLLPSKIQRFDQLNPAF